MPVINILGELEFLPPVASGGIGALLGVVFGSYLATLVVRWPQGLSANRGRSRCDQCGRTLRWFELVPLVSWLACRGRCRSCAGPIATVHPVLEMLCGLAGGVFFACGLPMLAPLCWLLVTLAVFDARYLWLPDPLVLALAIVALLAPPLTDVTTLAMRAAGGLAGFGALAGIAMAFRLAAGRTGLGGGDPKLFGALGLWVGLLNLPLVLLIACAFGFADYAMRRARGIRRESIKLPLGSYLCLTTIVLAALKPFVTLSV